MSRIESIVIVPGDARVTEVSDHGAVAVPLRSARRHDALAEALGRRLGVPAAVAEGAVPVPGGGTLVVCRPDVLDRLEESSPARLRWVVALELSRTLVLEKAEALELAAAVEVRDYGDWLTSAARPAAIFGRTALAAHIGAQIDPDPLHSGTHYARMTRARGDLPGLLGDYLAAYAEAYLPGT
ncbi:MAG TPA: hypothetical protein VF584_20580 [Longimicrobium sp.]